MLAFQYDDILCKEMNEEDQSASVSTSKNDFLTTDEEEKSLLLPEAAETGLSWQLAILFIMGEILGGGVVSIGGAMANTGIWQK